MRARIDVAPSCLAAVAGLAIVVTLRSFLAFGAVIQHSVPRATCGPTDHPESVQGEVTLAERFSDDSRSAYRCNLELISQFKGEGAFDGFAVFGNCVYYSTVPSPKKEHRGVVVLDVSDSRNPKATAYLTSPAMLNAEESLEVSATRRLLIGSSPPNLFDVFDLSEDCRTPRLASSVSLPGVFSHSGHFTGDGRTFYGARWPRDPEGPLPPAAFALDLNDPKKPGLIATWSPDKSWVAHSVSLNREATRAYVTVMRMADDREKAPNPNGVVILDVSNVHANGAAKIPVVGTLFWSDSHFAQLSLPIFIRGRPYLISGDIAGALGASSPAPADSCAGGGPGHGFARIVDISDDSHPKTVSKLMLEVASPENCLKVMSDPVSPLGYGVFGCSVDDAENAKLLACSQFEAGLRVFDVTDPTNPKEVAYYKPPAAPAGRGGQNAQDLVIVVPRFRMKELEIWFTSVRNGFQVVRFSDRFAARRPDLFPDYRSLASCPACGERSTAVIGGKSSASP